MIRRLSVFVVIALAGCLSPTSEEGFAPSAHYASEIQQCQERRGCELLCMGVFDVVAQDIADCRITRMAADGAYIRVTYDSDDSGDFGGVDYDDGGGYDPPSPPPDDESPYPDDDGGDEPDEPEPDDDDGYDGDDDR